MPCPNRTPEGNPFSSIAYALHHQLLTLGRKLLIQPSCRLCRAPLSPSAEVDPICPPCHERYQIRYRGLHGSTPLPWHGLSVYEGAFRSLLLQLKHRPNERRLSALIGCLRATLPVLTTAVLVPIPSWKRRRANPLPGLIASGLGRVRTDLLQRTRVSAGQHHLNRQQRLSNLSGAFRANLHAPAMELWLVDDILTTGGTALAAKQALLDGGHRVRGLICLGRTPARRLRR